jgi:hypothetical protein
MKKQGKAARTQSSLGIKPDPQTTGHTCGFHAMRALYRYLRMPTRGLRIRLGTDHHPFPPFPGRDAIESMLDRAGLDILIGTLPMDILAVLHEDGFEVETTDDLRTFRQGLTVSLRNNLPGIALVDGIAHWLLVDGKTSGKFNLVASCRSNPYSLTEARFRARFTAGIVLTDLRHPRNMGVLNYAACYRRGVAMCLKCVTPDITDLLNH